MSTVNGRSDATSADKAKDEGATASLANGSDFTLSKGTDKKMTGSMSADGAPQIDSTSAGRGSTMGDVQGNAKAQKGGDINTAQGASPNSADGAVPHPLASMDRSLDTAKSAGDRLQTSVPEKEQVTAGIGDRTDAQSLSCDSTESSAEKESTADVTVTLEPLNFPPIYRINEDGSEVVEDEVSSETIYAQGVSSLVQDFLKSRSESSSTSRKRRRTESRDGGHKSNISQKDSGKEETVGSDEEKSTEQRSGRTEDEEDVHRKRFPMDPRIYFRPAVESLSQASAELAQMLHLIELLRGGQHMQDMNCIREIGGMSEEDAAHLLHTKRKTTGAAGERLRKAASSMREGILRERRFFKDVMKLRGRWRIEAPMHGQVARPLHPGTMLAVDCRFLSAGSKYWHGDEASQNMQRNDYVELKRTLEGALVVDYPPDLELKLLELELEQRGTRTKRSFTPAHDGRMNTDQSTEYSRQLSNQQVLNNVQHTLFCREIFAQLMSEALSENSRWIGNSLSGCGNGKCAEKSQGVGADQTVGKSIDADRRGLDHRFTGSRGDGGLVVAHVMEDEIRLVLEDNCRLNIRLVPWKGEHSRRSLLHDDQASAAASVNQGKEAPIPEESVGSSNRNPQAGGDFMDTDSGPSVPGQSGDKEALNCFCEASVAFLQEGIRRFHGGPQMFKLIERGNQGRQKPAHKGLLKHLVDSLSHALQKRLLRRAVDESSVILSQPSARPVHLQAVLREHAGDLTAGLQLGVRSFLSRRTAYSAFRLHIGPSYQTDLILDGTKVYVAMGSLAKYGSLASRTSLVSSWSVLKRLFEIEGTREIIENLRKFAISYGFSDAEVSTDHRTLTLRTNKMWDGSRISRTAAGSGRCASERIDLFCDTKARQGMVRKDPVLTLRCLLQGEELHRLVARHGIPTSQNQNRGMGTEVAWDLLPGASDPHRLLWLLITLGWVRHRQI